MDGYNLNDRLNSVRDTTSEKKLKRYALDDYSEKVREIAVSKITDPALLCYIVKNDKSINVAKRAVQNIDDEDINDLNNKKRITLDEYGLELEFKSDQAYDENRGSRSSRVSY